MQPPRELHRTDRVRSALQMGSPGGDEHNCHRRSPAHAEHRALPVPAFGQGHQDQDRGVQAELSLLNFRQRPGEAESCRPSCSASKVTTDTWKSRCARPVSVGDSAWGPPGPDRKFWEYEPESRGPTEGPREESGRHQPCAGVALPPHWSRAGTTCSREPWLLPRYAHGGEPGRSGACGDTRTRTRGQGVAAGRAQVEQPGPCPGPGLRRRGKALHVVTGFAD